MSAGDRPPLLFISPTAPARRGGGLEMRAGLMLEALAPDYEVHLLFLPVARRSRHVAPEIAAWCARVVMQRVTSWLDPLARLIQRLQSPRARLAAHLALPVPVLSRHATARAVRRAARAVAGTRFREVHVFRLFMAPFAEPYLGAGPRCRLDLDDHDSRARQRLAALRESAGAGDRAAIERAEAEKYAAMERRYVSRFDRVYVGSELDRVEVERLVGTTNLAVIPNGVRLPASVPAPPDGDPFTFLFVGSLGYHPNEDAVLFFCSAVLPRLRALARSRFRLQVAGTFPSPELRALARLHPEVTVHGHVADVAPLYHAADAVVVPIRSGGGTRIKLLEAFAFRRPAVSTTIGAEGIEATHGVHLLVADAPDAFAEECARLMHTPGLGAALAARALDLVRSRHSLERIRELLRRDHATP